MAGLYLHIPFCKQACHYCNFHFSTSLRLKDDLLAAMYKELQIRQDYLGGAPLESIYLGGGTPSLLNAADLDRLFTAIYKWYPVDDQAEVTLEANPDDLTTERLKDLKDSPVNRLSIGIQSFSDADLRFMNRAHNAEESLRCLDQALAMGFADLTVDLIYGTPTMDDRQWEQNIQTVRQLGIPHLSCYALTVEERTALDHFVRTGKAPAVDEQQANRQFSTLMDVLEEAGYEHYEISNFALPGHYARHNSNYWKGIPYLGVGPSAHSYDRIRRHWNIANNARYIRALQTDLPSNDLQSEEQLTPAQHYNEYVLTRLRTIWGCRLDEIEAPFQTYFLEGIQPFIDSGHVQQDEDNFRLTKAGKFLADRIAMEVFWVE